VNAVIATCAFKIKAQSAEVIGTKARNGNLLRARGGDTPSPLEELLRIQRLGFQTRFDRGRIKLGSEIVLVGKAEIDTNPQVRVTV
jgi:hypothetical protein